MTERQVFDTDAACDACREMWIDMAEEWYGRAKASDTPRDAIEWASMANEAYWLATGENAPISIIRIWERGEHQPRKEGE